jgi:serine protease Do
MYNSVVSVMEDGLFGLQVVGSGVIIRRTAGKPILVLTAYHVIETVYSGTVPVGLKEHGISIQTNIIATNPGRDLALLEGVELEKSDGPYVELATATPEIGEDVWVIGAPNQVERSVSKGVLSNIELYRGGLQLFRTDADIYYGNSGGGMFDEHGKLIGITSKVELMNVGGIITAIVPGSGKAVGLPHIINLLRNTRLLGHDV